MSRALSILLALWIAAMLSPPDTAQAFQPASASSQPPRPWAFLPPAQPAVPRVRNRAWVRNPIDAFVLAKLEAKGLAPSPPADRRALLRRVTFDLTGLPPSPAEIDAFLADRRPDAYERVVRRLLGSPQYGERWAQHWLDVVRFGETNGFELDADRPQAWRYRDYVVRALNEDRPYDRFLAEQIAGDLLQAKSEGAEEWKRGGSERAPSMLPLLHSSIPDRLVATGFLRAGPQHVVAGNQDVAVNRQEWLTEAVTGVGTAVLGLTIQCARCHDHKFDPIPQADYYRLQAFFAGTDNSDFQQATPAEREAREIAVKAHEARLKPVEEQIAAIEKPCREQLRQRKREQLEPPYAAALATAETDRTPEQRRLASAAQRMLNLSWDEVLAALSPADRERRAGLRRKLHALELEEPPPLPVVPGVAEMRSPAPPTYILVRGDPHVPGTEVQPGFPAAIGTGGQVEERKSGSEEERRLDLPRFATSPLRPARPSRLDLARWMVRPNNPLTARVMVNRLWQRHFGRGIVATPNDFGKNGQPPTHPELLDWLACGFATGRMEEWKSGRLGLTTSTLPLFHSSTQSPAWRLKPLHYLMVTSSTYRQSSTWLPPSPESRRPEGTRNPKSIDPDNRLLWRMNRQRLDAEALRDAVLAAAGTLNPEMGGPPVRVPLEPEVYDTIFTEGEPDNLWPVAPDARQHTRRSLYLLRKRNVRLPLLAVFDQPDMMSSCAARGETVHALQTLTLMNSEFMQAQSRALARRLLLEESDAAEAFGSRSVRRATDGATRSGRRIQRLFTLTLGRPPAPGESATTSRFLAEQTQLRREANGDAAAWAADLAGVEPATAAAWADLCLAVLNLNDFVYVR